MKRLGKRHKAAAATASEEVKVAKMARRSAHDIVNEVMRARTTPRDMMRMAEQLSQSAHSQIDLGYIKTLLFPELYNADIP